MFMQAGQAARPARYDERPDRDTVPGELEGQVSDVVGDEGSGSPRLDEAGGDQDDDPLRDPGDCGGLRRPDLGSGRRERMLHRSPISGTDVVAEREGDGRPRARLCEHRAQQPAQPGNLIGRSARVAGDRVEQIIRYAVHQGVDHALVPRLDGVEHRRSGLIAQLQGRGRAPQRRGGRIETEHDPDSRQPARRRAGVSTARGRARWSRAAGEERDSAARLVGTRSDGRRALGAVLVPTAARIVGRLVALGCPGVVAGRGGGQ